MGNNQQTNQSCVNKYLHDISTANQHHYRQSTNEIKSLFIQLIKIIKIINIIKLTQINN